MFYISLSGSTTALQFTDTNEYELIEIANILC